VTRTFGPEQVYVCLWSHADGVPGHIHWVVQPVDGSDDPARRGPSLQTAMFDRGELPDPVAVERAADAVRSALLG
jgi:hypothetical protein